jgi:polysaccharide biosynthesis/export protein
MQLGKRPTGTQLALGGFALAALAAGCISNAWWNSFLDPTQVGNFHDSAVSEIQQTISFRDTPPGIAGSTDPTPDDLVQTVSEYEVGVGDQLSIRMLDFIARDVETEFTPTVDELGYIDIPQLGQIQVDGMTVRELRAELIQRAKDRGIYRRESEPTVTISFLNQQQRVYNLSGVVSTPGRYRIIPPDFRLRDAINQGGGLDPSVKHIYVFRNEPKPKRIVERGVHRVETQPAFEAPVPPVAPAFMSEQVFSPTVAAPAMLSQAIPAERPANATSQPRDAEHELIEAVTPARAGTDTATAPTQAPPATTSAPSLPPFIFVNDHFVETPAPQAAPKQAQAQPATAIPTTEPVACKPVDWQELGKEDGQRIIRIPADKLANGDVNYNIVIRHGDWIRLDAGYVGVFYLMGHIARPGVYSLSGQEITLRQAVAAAGGFDSLAWPTRCEIVRRIDGEREETTQWDLARILDGKDPDLFLKPEDVVNVGTHAIAPFLATIRNSFRLTYGFGFVYDRNFADIDAFSPQVNPRDRRRSQLAQRFPGLFP